MTKLEQDDIARVLSALDDLANGWPLDELIDGWREAAERLRQTLKCSLSSHAVDYNYRYGLDR